MEIRKAQTGDLRELLALYAQFGSEKLPASGVIADAAWEVILRDERQTVLVGLEDGRLVSSCVLVVVPNLTHGGRPYALIENVITRVDCRKRGLATALLNRARELAVTAGCYKIMLMTGSKLESTLKFYEQAGYSGSEKTAFVRWL